MGESSLYHAGELEVQERAQVRQQADELGEMMILPFIPPSANGFISRQRLAVMGTVASEGSVWASALIGDPGFLSLPDEQTLHIAAPAQEDDPVWKNLSSKSRAGVLILDPGARKRMRVNGSARLTSTGISVTAEQVFTNCTKYIQRRVPIRSEANQSDRHSYRSRNLSAEQENWINRADTFFLATFHPEAGADASHRGGMPGFIVANSPNDLAWPDYSGNNMFLSLGNLLTYPRAGLLFVDFERGRSLQLTGEAETIWEPEQFRQFPGAKRLLKFRVNAVIETDSAFVQRWQMVEFSPVNPPIDPA